MDNIDEILENPGSHGLNQTAINYYLLHLATINQRYNQHILQLQIEILAVLEKVPDDEYEKDITERVENITKDILALSSDDISKYLRRCAE